jgi:hypothetical protein
VFAPQHPCDGIGHFASFSALDQLAVAQIIMHVPIIFPGTWWAKPPAKMSRYGMEIGKQSIGCESWDTGPDASVASTHAPGCKRLPPGDHPDASQVAFCSLDRSLTTASVPRGLFHFSVQFIHLDQIEGQVAKGQGVPARARFACPVETFPQGGFLIPGLPFQDRNIHSCYNR